LRFFLEWLDKKLQPTLKAILDYHDFPLNVLNFEREERYAYGYLKMLDGMAEVMEMNEDEQNMLFAQAKKDIVMEIDWKELYRYS